MTSHAVVTQDEWLVARQALLAKEKEFTRLRDELSAARRGLPWTEVEKPYRFEGPAGALGLAGLFAGRSQLVVYHFMFHPDWKAGCKSCSFWADHFAGVAVHLAQRDVTLAAVSRAPLAMLEAFKKRQGWSHTWVSSLGSDFNYDFGVTFTPEEIAAGPTFYNYRLAGHFKSEERPGISVFFKDAEGAIYHTYSCYARGLDMLNGTYQFLDIVPKGRDEDGFSMPMAWVRIKDEYSTQA